MKLFVNVEERWLEHNSAGNKSEPNILLITKNTPNCEVFYLKFQKMAEHAKFFEAFFIAKLKPSLNILEDSNMPTLFRNNVT